MIKTDTTNILKFLELQFKNLFSTYSDKQHKQVASFDKITRKLNGYQISNSSMGDNQNKNNYPYYLDIHDGHLVLSTSTFDIVDGKLLENLTYGENTQQVTDLHWLGTLNELIYTIGKVSDNTSLYKFLANYNLVALNLKFNRSNSARDIFNRLNLSHSTKEACKNTLETFKPISRGLSKCYAKIALNELKYSPDLYNKFERSLLSKISTGTLLTNNKSQVTYVLTHKDCDYIKANADVLVTDAHTLNNDVLGYLRRNNIYIGYQLMHKLSLKVVGAINEPKAFKNLHIYGQMMNSVCHRYSLYAITTNHCQVRKITSKRLVHVIDKLINRRNTYQELLNQRDEINHKINAIKKSWIAK